MALPGPRVTCQPLLFNSSQLSGTFPPASSPGYDSGSGTITAWGSNQGVMIPNNGEVVLYWASGTAGAGVTQVFIGDLIGNTGQVAPATDEQVTLPATSSGWLGPWSPALYNQQAPTAVTYAGAINTTALVAAAQGCVVSDFTTTTNFVVRAYQLVPVTP